MVVAQARNRVIGRANDLPWYLPADLKHFKELTSGRAVIMGRKTFESIIARRGQPLPNRTNIVVSRDAHFQAEGATVVATPEEALKAAGSGEVFVIGGGAIFEAMLPMAERLYLTQVEADIEGDAYFPALDPDEWRPTSTEHHKADEKNQYDYAFITMERTS
ncbi:MAG TPA: dihydrofolate reductase [Candidatus Saccharimonadia bacterium]|jgi:dihydrofolate reductase|nr:dihydrofolate reductase [Candidatus Saccharimonadia bacterium]